MRGLMVAASMMMFVSCTQQASAPVPSHHPSASTPSAQPTQATSTTATASSVPTAQVVVSGSRCATGQLRFSLGKVAAATTNWRQSITITNGSASTCYLGGYPGVQLLDGAGHPLQDARWSSASFFGSYGPPSRVDLPPEGATSFDLTFGSNDPCGPMGPGQHGAALRITPPGDYDSSVIAATLLVCAKSLVAHAVGSTVSTP